MNCVKCDNEITDKNLLIVNGYKRKTCKSCIQKQSREINRKKYKKLKEWRKWYE